MQWIISIWWCLCAILILWIWLASQCVHTSITHQYLLYNCAKCMCSSPVIFCMNNARRSTIIPPQMSCSNNMQYLANYTWYSKVIWCTVYWNWLRKCISLYAHNCAYIINVHSIDGYDLYTYTKRWAYIQSHNIRH